MPGDYPAVEKVRPLEGYRLEVQFKNGESGILDMTPYLDFGVFRQLRDPERFRSVTVAFDTIEWEGAIDLDPEFVYEKTHLLAPS